MMKANLRRVKVSPAIWAMISVAMPEIGYSWTPNPQNGRATWQLPKDSKKPEILRELIPLGGSKRMSEPDFGDAKRDWDHYSINDGDPHFLFSEEHYKTRNSIDRETVIEITVPFIAPVLAFLSYDFVASTFHAGIDYVANNNWRAVDGGAYAAQIITPTINGIVLPAIAVLFATLTAMTIRTLRDRQIDIRSCINAEAGELRAFEYIISAYPSGSEIQSMCRQYLLQYTSRIIAESQSKQHHPLTENHLPSTQHGMDSELNGVLRLLARTEVLPTLLHDQSFQAVWRLRQSRQNRLTALQSTYPSLHYGILAILAFGEMTGFLIEGNQELLVFLNAVQLKLLWSMLVGTFVSCFMVFYDLLHPFSGCYQVTAAVDQLHTVRLGLRAQTQLSLLDYNVEIQESVQPVRGNTEDAEKDKSNVELGRRTEDENGLIVIPEKANGSIVLEKTNNSFVPDTSNGSLPPEVTNGSLTPKTANGSSAPQKAKGSSAPQKAKGSCAPPKAKGPSAPPKAKGPSWEEVPNVRSEVHVK